MRQKILLSLLIGFFISNVKLLSAQEGLPWLYISPAGLPGALTPELQPGAGGQNPAAPGWLKQISFYGASSFSSSDQLISAGVSIPLNVGVISVGGKSSTHVLPLGYGSLSSFNLGFAKELDRNILFGFQVYGGVLSTTNSADFALGLSLGGYFRTGDWIAFSRGIGFKNTGVGVSLHGLGKPVFIDSSTPYPGIGATFTLSGTWLDFGWLTSSAAASLLADAWPLQASMECGIGLTFFKVFTLQGGVLLGSSGLGGWGEGAGWYTAGAALDFPIEEFPLRVYYTMHPVVYSGNSEYLHTVGIESRFGGPDKTPPKVSLTVDGSNTAVFSPNFDGIKDTLRIAPSIYDENRIESWKLLIYTEDGELARMWQGQTPREEWTDISSFFKKLFIAPSKVQLPETFDWNGTSENGTILKDGTYTAVLSAKDEWGNSAVSETNRFELDTLPPSGTVDADAEVFSPNGDGSLDQVHFLQKLSPDSWRGEIRDTEGHVLKNFSFGTPAETNVAWNGDDNSGKILSEGTYDYLLYGEDPAGNRAILSKRGIQISLRRYSVWLRGGSAGFSPNGDGKMDTFTFYPTVSDTNSLENWELQILQGNGSVLLTTNGLKKLPREIVWDGKLADGTIIADQTCFAIFRAEFTGGDKPQTPHVGVVVDTTPPEIGFACSPQPFSPDNDGEDDTLFMHPVITDTNGVLKWNLEIVDPDNNPFRVISGMGEVAPTLRWDGRSDQGELVESARDYPVLIRAEDPYGNLQTNHSLIRVAVDVLVERTDEGLKIRINNIEFEFGKAALKPVSMPILDRVAQILKKYPSYRIEVQGHTDNIGSVAKNRALSLERAEVVAGYLARKGIPRSRMGKKGFGFDKPIADNSTEQGRRKNRRVEFILIKN